MVYGFIYTYENRPIRQTINRFMTILTHNLVRNPKKNHNSTSQDVSRISVFTKTSNFVATCKKQADIAKIIGTMVMLTPDLVSNM